MIAGLFDAVKDNGYDTVVIVGPNHEGVGGDVVVSTADWAYGVACNVDLIEKIMDIPISGSISIDDRIVADDHAVAALIPFIGHYLPGAAVAPMLLNKSLTYNDVMIFADTLTGIIDDSGKRVLLLCSIDFSHYLTPSEARARDAETLGAMTASDYKKIYSFTDAHADSRAALIVFLRYIKANGLILCVVDNADASVFMGPDIRETTSYFILASAQPAP